MYLNFLGLRVVPHNFLRLALGVRASAKLVPYPPSHKTSFPKFLVPKYQATKTVSNSSLDWPKTIVNRWFVSFKWNTPILIWDWSLKSLFIILIAHHTRDIIWMNYWTESTKFVLVISKTYYIENELLYLIWIKLLWPQNFWFSLKFPM